MVSYRNLVWFYYKLWSEMPFEDILSTGGRVLVKFALITSEGFVCETKATGPDEKFPASDLQ